jgi:two-component sensor histidine kinase
MIYRRPDGTLIHLEVSSTPMRWAGGEAFAVSAFYDITERKHAEDHQRLLINELNHRVKNTLATVQSIAAQSLRAVEAADDGGPVARARAAFEDRLFALARAHDVLTRGQWESAALADIVGEAVAPHRGSTAGADRFAIDGPPLRAAPKMALSLSMALHELATNAVKYGALSGPGGRVVVGWTLPGSDAGRRMRLEWREEGGPAVTPPVRKGFGTRLIEQGLARELGGTVELVYDRAGLRCLIDVPLEH